MVRHLIVLKWLVCLFLLGLFLMAQPAFAVGSKLVILGTGNETQRDTGANSNKENVILDRVGGEPIETLVVTLNDLQVRHLIEALTKQPPQAAAIKSEEKVGGLAGLIKKIQNLSHIIQERIHTLKSGVGTDPENLPHLFKLISKDENQGKPDPFKTILSVSGLLTASLVILWLFRRYTTAYYRRIESATFADWKSKIGGLTLGSLLDFISMFIFAMAALAIFFIFMKRSGPQSVLAATYLIAFLIVMGVQLISRFFLAPKVPALRFLPMDDETARYLYRWIIAIAVVGSFGFLTCGIFRVAGISEANHLMMVAMVELVIVAMIITMILQKRQQVKQALRKDLPATGLRALLIRIWHNLAIIALLLLWILSGFNLLLRKFILAVLVVMATLIILSSIGVNIGPLIAGAGVIGLAIGFGAQTLVKDIIAGLFFLMDDAFRVGDYIKTGGTKGMVEHISLRSLRLRHPRGMVNTIPFGDMGIVTNMSRDYIITKLDFRVRYDTDVERVRKIIKKKVYEPIMQNEKLASKLLDKIKSQGVREMDDSAMIMRVKYKTAPGEQFVIRKEVYRLMQEAFAEEGIEFAHRNVTVYIPPDTDETKSGEKRDEGATTGTSDKKLKEKAGAAAAIAAAQADEDAKKPK
jgi:small-conductance mechanosensitive channel